MTACQPCLQDALACLAAFALNVIRYVSFHSNGMPLERFYPSDDLVYTIPTAVEAEKAGVAALDQSEHV